MALRPGGDVAVVWFRRDLRLHDNPALTAALASSGRVAPLFVVDPEIVPWSVHLAEPVVVPDGQPP